jgi:hypothetical protein
MNLLTTEEASARALRDWQKQTVRVLVVGTIRSSVPRLDWGNLFYTETLGCEYSDEADAYSRTYNRTVRSLLAKHGIPSWCPVKRLPNAGSCLELCAARSSLFALYQPHSEEEEKLYRRLLHSWGVSRPLIWCAIPQQGILLWGGNISEKLGRIDIIDIQPEAIWMAMYQYPREEYPTLPWDSTGGGSVS